MEGEPGVSRCAAPPRGHPAGGWASAAPRNGGPATGSAALRYGLATGVAVLCKRVAKCGVAIVVCSGPQELAGRWWMGRLLWGIQLTPTHIQPLGALQHPVQTHHHHPPAPKKCSLCPEGHPQHPRAQESHGTGGEQEGFVCVTPQINADIAWPRGHSLHPESRSRPFSQTWHQLQISQCKFCTTPVVSLSAIKTIFTLLALVQPSPQKCSISIIIRHVSFS